jgi:hypothetical protein
MTWRSPQRRPGMSARAEYARGALTRRFFLRGAAGAVLALPFLPSLLPRALRAQAIAPKRLIVMKSFSTQLIREWYPAFSGRRNVPRLVKKSAAF